MNSPAQLIIGFNALVFIVQLARAAAFFTRVFTDPRGKRGTNLNEMITSIVVFTCNGITIYYLAS